MPTLLKDLYFNNAFYQKLAKEIQNVYPAFSTALFQKDAARNLAALELNQRLRQTSVALQKHLPSDYKEAIEILSAVIPRIEGGYANLVFPDFVGLYGHDLFDTSMAALKLFTQFGSSEFAIREFLKRDFAKTIAVMKKWAGDENYHVRRLASEGSRPRLPWSFKLDAVVKNPALTLPILERLKSDDELYVRKSVANHLNDFSKDHAPLLVQTVKKWDLSHEHTAWIVKHACRTLIKQGDPAALALFAFEKDTKVKVKKLRLESARIKIGGALQFAFDVTSEKNKPQKLAIDFTIYYRKKAGGLAPKVFKLKEVTLGPRQTLSLSKTQRMQNFTTRQHYPGKHQLVVTINGTEVAEKSFELVK
ncbi:MAG: DNA alkylation repair protein [Spirochaetes bacterium]|nr:DNA alkylation repair protein [Spirochaetota bacterium]